MCLPAITRSSVDLPAPFAPITRHRAPGSTARSTWSRTTRVPPLYVNVRPRTAMIGSRAVTLARSGSAAGRRRRRVQALPRRVEAEELAPLEAGVVHRLDLRRRQDLAEPALGVVED